MFEKEAEEWEKEIIDNADVEIHFGKPVKVMPTRKQSFQKGAEFGYNKAKEESMLKLKDEGIVKLLKDSIFYNERLSSQEQQELSAWVECAMDFGSNLDECAEQLAKTKELLAKWVELFKPKLDDFPKPPIQEETEQFLKEVE